jgi:hypothetical protein
MSYSQEALYSALEEIKLGSSLRAAAKKYNVPVTTLHDHKSGKVAPGAKKRQRSITSSYEREGT